MGKLVATQVHAHAFASGGAGTTYTITVPAMAAGSRIIIRAYGGSQQTYRLTNGSGTAFTRRAQALSAIDVSIHDVAAAGGETAIHVTLVGDENVVTVIDQTDLGAFIAGSSNGSGASAAIANDFQSTPSSAVTVSGAAALVGAFGVQTATAYDGTTQFRCFGPLGQLDVNGAQQPGSGTKHIYGGGWADVDASHSYPVGATAGQYKATSTWVQGGTTYAAQAAYAAGATPMVALPANPVVRANSLPGTHQQNWFLGSNNNSGTIAGFTRACSYQPGDTVQWSVDTASADGFTVDVWRLGYQGWESLSALKVAHLTGTGAAQSAPVVDSTLGSTSCAAWSVNATWTVPSDAASGVYFYILRRVSDTSKVCGGHFVVRPAAVTGKVVVVIPDTTYQAYNIWGATGDGGSRAGGTWSGRSLYTSGATPTDVFTNRAYAVCRDRPLGTAAMQPNTGMWDSDQGVITFLEAQGYDLVYLSDTDLEADPTILQDAKLAIMQGHHEYISDANYTAWENARAAGVNLFINGSNFALWRVRYDPADTNKRTIICYKESATRDVGAGFTGTGYDPDTSWTGTRRDTTPANGKTNNNVKPEIAFTGQAFEMSAPISASLHVPDTAKVYPCWRNSTAVQALGTGTAYATPWHILGDEVESPNGTAGQPANLVMLCQDSLSGTTGANAAGTIYSTTKTITVTWTMYRHSSDALVVMTGSWRGLWSVSQWAKSGWGVEVTDPDEQWQNLLLCILYDLGAVPTAAREMRPGIDAALTDPSVGAPVGWPDQRRVARAYFLKVPTSSGMFFAAT